MKDGRFVSLFSRLALVLSMALLSAGQAAGAESADVLYLNLVWHQHQPLYYKDAAGVYSRPWVRVHATKDYYDMAAMLEGYPNVNVTFNLTPVLIKQLDDIISGAKDIYWVLAEKPVQSLTDADKRFILRRFFDANYGNVIGRFPRYKELLDKRAGSGEQEIEKALKAFSEQDFRDLQVWFNLAWFDPDFLSQEPLKALVAKGRNFAEADKKPLFSRALEIIKAVVPKHKELQDKGRIEVITTPYAHPILPLIFNSDLAAKGDPTAELPERFSYPQDAIAQLARSVEVYEKHYGRKPRGMWPAEGAVGQDIVKIVSDAGYQWMASGEQVLAKSLGMKGFVRDGKDVVEDADQLYRPYYAQVKDGRQVAVVFRDLRLSDLIGFEYSGTPGEIAAQNFMDRLEAIRRRLAEQGAAGPHLVSVILDGENAWENYPNDGKAFLNALYKKLSESRTVKTITLSRYLERFPEQRALENLWWGCWFTPDYSTWIGEPEETLAWNYLGKTRRALAQYDMFKKKTTTPEKLARALDFMYLAEGSDWFWWFGSDQSSGDDEYFDESFRSLLSQVYSSLGEQVPDYLKVPVIPRKPVPPEKAFDGPFTPSIDGKAAPGEWDKAGAYLVQGGAMAKASELVRGFYFGFDEKTVYFRVDAAQDWSGLAPGSAVDIFFSHPKQVESTALTQRNGVLAFRAGYMIEVPLQGKTQDAKLWKLGKYDLWDTVQVDLKAGMSGRVLEIALPLAGLEYLQPGDVMNMQVVLASADRDLSFVPASGPAQAVIPDLGTSQAVLVVNDPAGDDHGPGSYTYPTDPVFEPGVFDIDTFSIMHNEENIIFRFRINGSIRNPWGSGINLSVQTFDVYIDLDPGAGTGSRKLLEGRNASMAKGFGWEYAVWVEGWSQKVIVPDENGKPAELSGSPVKVIVDSPKHEVTILVPKKVLGGGSDPGKWAYVAALLSQEGYPAAGVRRVREVLPKAEQWRIGGGPDDTNHTRIMDVAWPKGASPTQEEFLGKYPPSQETDMGVLSPDDFAQVPALRP